MAFRCSECMESADSQASLWAHVNLHHLGAIQYQCYYCDKNKSTYFCLTERSLKDHVLLQHPNQPIKMIKSMDQEEMKRARIYERCRRTNAHLLGINEEDVTPPDISSSSGSIPTTPDGSTSSGSSNPIAVKKEAFMEGEQQAVNKPLDALRASQRPRSPTNHNCGGCHVTSPQPIDDGGRARARKSVSASLANGARSKKGAPELSQSMPSPARSNSRDSLPMSAKHHSADNIPVPSPKRSAFVDNRCHFCLEFDPTSSQASFTKRSERISHIRLHFNSTYPEWRELNQFTFLPAHLKTELEQLCLHCFPAFPLPPKDCFPPAPTDCTRCMPFGKCCSVDISFLDKKVAEHIREREIQEMQHRQRMEEQREQTPELNEQILEQINPKVQTIEPKRRTSNVSRRSQNVPMETAVTPRKRKAEEHEKQPVEAPLAKKPKPAPSDTTRTPNPPPKAPADDSDDEIIFLEEKPATPAANRKTTKYKCLECNGSMSTVIAHLFTRHYNHPVVRCPEPDCDFTSPFNMGNVTNHLKKEHPDNDEYPIDSRMKHMEDIKNVWKSCIEQPLPDDFDKLFAGAILVSNKGKKVKPVVKQEPIDAIIDLCDEAPPQMEPAVRTVDIDRESSPEEEETVVKKQVKKKNRLPSLGPLQRQGSECKLCKAHVTRPKVHLYEEHLMELTVRCPYCNDFGSTYDCDVVYRHIKDAHPGEKPSITDNSWKYTDKFSELSQQCFGVQPSELKEQKEPEQRSPSSPTEADRAHMFGLRPRTSLVAYTEQAILSHQMALIELKEEKERRKQKASLEAKNSKPPPQPRCVVCDRNAEELMIDKHSMEQHQVTCERLNPFKCDICPKRFKMFATLRVHQQYKHKHYNCSFGNCGWWALAPNIFGLRRLEASEIMYRFMEKIKRHEHSHGRRAKRFSYIAPPIVEDTAEPETEPTHSYSLRANGSPPPLFLSLKSQPKPFKCERCAKGFSNEKSLQLHQIQCMQSREQVRQKISDIIYGSDWQCIACSQLIGRLPSDVELHLMINHLGTDTVQCSVCQFGHRWDRNAVQKHIKEAHARGVVVDRKDKLQPKLDELRGKFIKPVEKFAQDDATGEESTDSDTDSSECDEAESSQDTPTSSISFSFPAFSGSDSSPVGHESSSATSGSVITNEDSPPHDESPEVTRESPLINNPSPRSDESVPASNEAQISDRDEPNASDSPELQNSSADHDDLGGSQSAEPTTLMVPVVEPLAMEGVHESVPLSNVDPVSMDFVNEGDLNSEPAPPTTAPLMLEPLGIEDEAVPVVEPISMDFNTDDYGYGSQSTQPSAVPPMLEPLGDEGHKDETVPPVVELKSAQPAIVEPLGVEGAQSERVPPLSNVGAAVSMDFMDKDDYDMLNDIDEMIREGDDNRFSDARSAIDRLINSLERQEPNV